MKKFFIKACSIVLCIVFCFSFISCNKKDKDYLYNWLMENGELVGATTLSFEDSIDINHSYELSYSYGNIDVEYFIADYEGYCVNARLPLYSSEINAPIYISVENKNNVWRSYEYTFNPEAFQKKSPLKYVDSSGDTIDVTEYSYFKDNKYYIDLNLMPNGVKEKYKEIGRLNKLCENLVQPSLCSILDWLNNKICPLADMELSDFGYESYK